MDTDTTTGDSNIETTPQDLTCAHCGHTDDQVTRIPTWIGGRGYQNVPYCLHIPSCDARYKQAHPAA